jgi:hypothetical protein
MCPFGGLIRSRARHDLRSREGRPAPKYGSSVFEGLNPSYFPEISQKDNRSQAADRHFANS